MTLPLETILNYAAVFAVAITAAWVMLKIKDEPDRTQN